MAQKPPFTVARKGNPAPILLPADAKERLMPIAQELQRWLGEIIGNPPAIETATPNKVGILLGTAKEFPDLARRHRLSELGNEGFVIRSEKINFCCSLTPTWVCATPSMPSLSTSAAVGSFPTQFGHLSQSNQT